MKSISNNICKVFVLFVLYNTVISQDIYFKIDSLLNIIENSKQDTTRGINYIKIAALLADISNSDTIIMFSEKGISILEKELENYSKNNGRNLIKYIIKGYNVKANFYVGNYNHEKATILFNKAIRLSDSIQHIAGKAAALTGLGTIYSMQGKTELAMQCYLNSIEILTKLNDRRGLAINYLNIGDLYASTNEYEKALKYYNKSLKIYKGLNDSLSLSYVFNAIGVINCFKGDFEEAIYYYKKSLEICEKTNNIKILTSVYGNIGGIYYYIGDLSNSLDYIFKSLKSAEKIKDKTQIGYCYSNIGIIYSDLQDYEKAKFYLNKSYEIHKELGDKESILSYYINIGDVYFKLGDIKKALYNYEEGLKLSKELKNKSYESNIYYKIGEVYLIKGNIKKAINQYNISYKLAKEINSPEDLARSFSGLANAYIKLNQYDKAYKYALEGYKITKEKGFYTLTEPLAEILSRLENRRGNYKKALKYYKEYIEIRDSINSSKHQKEIIRKELTHKYEKEKSLQEAKYKAAIEKQKLIAKSQRRKRNIIIFSIILILLITLGFAIVLYSRYKVIKEQKNIIEGQKQKLEKQKEKLISINEQLEQKNIEVKGQAEQLKNLNEILERKNKNIMDSIKYAWKIQKALLKASDMHLEKSSINYFLLYKPRDIVSGDFYWCYNKNEETYIAVADCTGHGVPGSLISMLGMDCLSRIVENGTSKTSEILNKLRQSIINRLNPTVGTPVKEGMDISILKINKNRKIQWSGANNPLYIITDNYKTKAELSNIAEEKITEGKWSLLEIKPDKQPVGYYSRATEFTQHNFKLNKGDIIILFSDGFPDQFGGPNNKKFSYKRFRKMFLKLASQNNLTVEKLQKILEKWQNTEEQIDDITIMGIIL